MELASLKEHNPTAQESKSQVERYFNKANKIGRHFLDGFYTLPNWKITRKDVTTENNGAAKTIKIITFIHKRKKDRKIVLVYERENERNPWDFKGIEFNNKIKSFVLKVKEGKVALFSKQGNNYIIQKNGLSLLGEKQKRQLNDFLLSLRVDIAVIDALRFAIPKELFLQVAIPTIAVAVLGSRLLSLNMTSLPVSVLNMLDRPQVSETLSLEEASLITPPSQQPDIGEKSQNGYEQIHPEKNLFLLSNIKKKKFKKIEAMLRKKGGEVYAVANLQTINLVTKLLESGKEMNGRVRIKAMRSFLLSQKGINGHYLYRLYETRNGNIFLTAGLNPSLEVALSLLESEKAPYSQEAIFSFVKSFASFNGLHIATPQGIASQIEIKVERGITADAILNYNWTDKNLKAFNNSGQIQARWINMDLDSSYFPQPGEVLVTSNKEIGMGIVLFSGVDDKGEKIVYLWRYNEETGEFRIQLISSNDLKKNTSLTFSVKNKK